MIVRGSFVLFFSVVFFSFNVVSSLTHDQKKDMISEAYMSLKNVVQSLLDVHTTIQNGEGDAEKDIAELKDSRTRTDYEVGVMDIEHKIMLAEAAKRSDVSPQEEADATERGEAIKAAKLKVQKLDDKIQETEGEMDTLNTKMKASTLSADSLQQIQEDANNGQDPDDHITMPSTADIKIKVEEQLANVQTVIETLADTDPVKQEALGLKESILTKFGDVLNESSGQTVAQLTVTLKQIDVDLLHLRDLDLYGSAAKMEL